MCTGVIVRTGVMEVTSGTYWLVLGLAGEEAASCLDSCGCGLNGCIACQGTV